MKQIKTAILAFLIIGLVVAASACSSPAILKGNDFPGAYKSFLKTMQKNPPVSVAYEQYLKTEGFDEKKLITDNDALTIRELTKALAAVKIVKQVETASNFAVKHYTFTDKKGKTYTFEFFGSFLKVADKYYETENSLPFISIRPAAKQSGDFLVALDEVYEGKGEYAGSLFLSCRKLEQTGDTVKEITFAEFTLAPEAEIEAPTGQGRGGATKRYTASEFSEVFEQLKGQENESFIFEARVEQGSVLRLHYRADFSAEGIEGKK